jgi:hypothetical protein
MRTFVLISLVAATFATSRLAVAGEPPPTAKPPATPSPAPAAPVATAAPVVTVPTFGNGTCPIMGKPSSKALFTDTDYGRIYVCCPPCVKKIQLDAERAYKAAYPALKQAGNILDPVTGAKIGDKPVLITLQGYEIALASEDSVKPARANAQITLIKATRPDVVDFDNHTDPITGQPVANNAFVLIDKDLVHLSAPSVVDSVRLDPEKARKAAKAIAAKEAEEREKAKSAGQPR